ncbi:hypothetical protein K2173_011085 [Erythroxylum novogranatense]|uniref:Uncharacterized protein n=1 Tax=Erythroxylum novogranatense TaxID=1862640 RepID=A0AAV8T1T5_9ROSI|nr:hypothetical protein K2173_011085 [Erythroxylum novogranatense]
MPDRVLGASIRREERSSGASRPRQNEDFYCFSPSLNGGGSRREMEIDLRSKCEHLRKGHIARECPQPPRQERGGSEAQGGRDHGTEAAAKWAIRMQPKGESSGRLQREAQLRPVCDRNVSPLDTPLMVSTPIGQHIIINQVYRDYELCIGGARLVVDLMPLKMGGLDVILGMDTLEKYNARLDCK